MTPCVHLVNDVEPVGPVEVEDAVKGGRVPVKVVLVVLEYYSSAHCSTLEYSIVQYICMSL